MSIEWNVYEVRPVGLLQLVQAADRTANRLLGDQVLDFSESLASASQAGMSQTFLSQVYVTCDNFHALVDIEAGAMIEDADESTDHRPLLGTVSSRRTLLSVTLGFVVAVSWLDQGGGELSGAGLGWSFSEKDVDSLVTTFSPGQIVGQQGVVLLARKIVGDNARLDFA